DAVPVTGLAGALNSLTYYKIIVPAGQDSLLFSMSGGTGNADLYIKKGSKPTTSSYDYKPTQAGNTESVSIGGNSVPGTWYVMIKGTAAYSGVTLVADYSASTTAVTLTNGVPVTNISAAQGGAKYYKIEVPSGQTKLEIAMSGGTGDADMYVKFGEVPTTSLYDYRPYLPGNDETVTVNNPTAGTWYIMLRGYQAFSGVTLLATYGGTVPDTVVELQNGVAVNGLTGSAGGETYYKIVVPSGQAKLEIAMSGGTGDADMYVRKGSKPTTTEWDYRPYQIGNNETVTIDNPAAATYYIMLRGYVAYSGVTLKATYTGAAEVITTLQNGVAVTSLTGTSGGETFFKIDVPSGQDSLLIEMSGGTGDADMYVRKGSKPTTTNWDYRPYLIGNNETVEIASPAAATWYIMLRGYQAYTGVTLKATYGVEKKGNNFSVDTNAVAVWDFEADKLTIDSIKGLELDNSGVVADTTTFKQGESSARFDTAAQYWAEDYTFYMGDVNLPANFPGKSGTSNKTFSIAFWANFGVMTVSSELPLVSKRNIGAGQASYEIVLTQTAQVALRIGTGTGYTEETLTHGSSLVAGRWYHIVATFDNTTHTGTISVWDDTAGAILATDVKKTDFSAMNVDAATFVIGGVDNPWYETTNGLMDEVAIFNDVLTTTEIAKIRAGTYGK
ncbi:MAG: pre-peptidase C-terminal domain-containing protein, partial [Solirubrobacterales bacterium]